MAGRDYWLSIAQSPDPDDLREHISPGFKSGKPFTPYVPTITIRRHTSCACSGGRHSTRRAPPTRGAITKRARGYNDAPKIRATELSP